MTGINVEVKDGVTVLTYPEGDKEAEQAATKTILQKVQEIYEGDVLFPVIAGCDYIDGMAVTDEPKVHPHQRATMDSVREYWFNQGYRAGLGGKPTLELLSVQRQIEAMKDGAVPIIICDERHPLDPKESHEKLMRILESHARMSLPKGLGKFGFLHDSFPNSGYYALGGDYRLLSCYDDFKHQYLREVERSRTTDVDKRHEEICKVLLAPHKKKRKSFRKVLDQIGGELKHEQRNAEGNASDNV